MTRTYPTKCDTICPYCGERNTIFKPDTQMMLGVWHCDTCGWSGYPKDFEHIF